MALSEDAVAIVAAQLTTARLASKKPDDVSHSLVFEVFTEFRKLVQAAEDSRDGKGLRHLASRVVSSDD